MPKFFSPLCVTQCMINPYTARYQVCLAIWKGAKVWNYQCVLNGWWPNACLAVNIYVTECSASELRILFIHIKLLPLFLRNASLKKKIRVYHVFYQIWSKWNVVTLNGMCLLILNDSAWYFYYKDNKSDRGVTLITFQTFSFFSDWRSSGYQDVWVYKLGPGRGWE